MKVFVAIILVIVCLALYVVASKAGPPDDPTRRQP